MEFKATFEIEKGEKVFFNGTPEQDIVILAGTGRGVVISTPPPSFQGKLKVTYRSHDHQRGAIVDYTASFIPYPDEYYEFIDLQGDEVELIW